MQTIKPISRQLTDYLTSIGLYIQPKPNSIFAPLAEALAEEAEAEFTEDVSTESFVAQINANFDNKRPSIFAASFESAEEAEEVKAGVFYDELCLKAVAELKPIVLGIVDGLKNNVNPTISTIFENAYNRVSDMVETGGVKLSIETNRSELALWSNAAFGELLAHYVDKNSHQCISTDITFPEMAVDNLVAAIKTGNGLIDAEVAEFLSEYNLANLVEHTYSEIFNVKEATRYPGQGQLPESVAAFFMVIHFMENIPEGCYGMEHDAYRNELGAVAAWHANYIVETVQGYLLDAQADRLIISFPSDGSMYDSSKAIVVCGVAYNKFLDQGGSVDAIYGSYVGTKERRMHEILADGPRLEQQWLTHVQIAQSSNLDDFQRKFVHELRRELYKYSEEHGIKLNTSAIDEMYERSFVLAPSDAFIKTRSIMIDALWPDTDYNAVLKAVDAVCDKLEGVEFDEALELGIIEWLVQWSMDHVEVKQLPRG